MFLNNYFFFFNVKMTNNCKFASVLVFGCRRQQKRHAAAPPPACMRRRMERKRQKLVGRDKGSLTEQQTEGTVTTTVQIRRKHDKKPDPLSRTAPVPHAPGLRE